MLRVKAGAAASGFAAAQVMVSGTLARSEAGCLLIDKVLHVPPAQATENNGSVVIAGNVYPLGGALTGSGGFLEPGAVAQVLDEAGLAAWKGCGAPQQPAVIADESTVS